MTLPRNKRLTTPDPPSRDETRELIWLELAEAEGGESGFAEHALRRLAGDELYCDRLAKLGLP